MSYSNIEKLPAKPYYTGYANFRGKQCIYLIHNVKGQYKDGIVWRGRSMTELDAPFIYGKTLGEISSALYNLAIQFPPR